LGATRLLKTTECVYFEATEWAMKKYGYSFEDLYDILTNNNFLLFRITDSNISPISRTYRPKAGISGEDLLAIKNINAFLHRTGYKLTSN
jgi:hypothetical protein